MEQVIEFVGNHPLLTGGFAAVLAILLWTEFGRRTQRFRLLAPPEAVAKMNSDDALVVDVSPVADFNKGHIAGARHVPMSRFRSPDPDLEKLTAQPLIVVCKSGQTATQAASSLVRMGASDVSVLRGGMSQWVADHYPVSKK